MKVPSSVLQFVYNLVMSNVGNLAEAPLEKIPHIEVIAKAYNDGEPLEVIVGLYLQATESVSDDAVAGKVGEVLDFVRVEIPKVLAEVSEKPFKEVLAGLLGPLAVPDFNETKGDEVKVIDIINNVFKEIEN